MQNTKKGSHSAMIKMRFNHIHHHGTPMTAPENTDTANHDICALIAIDTALNVFFELLPQHDRELADHLHVELSRAQSAVHDHLQPDIAAGIDAKIQIWLDMLTNNAPTAPDPDAQH